jgi:hypothetical protein
MKYTILFFLMLSSISTQAQDCSKELLAQKPGTWKAGPQGFIQNVSVKDLAQEKLLLAAIYKMLSTNYSPKGCQVGYSTVFGKHLPAGLNWISDPYYLDMPILPYLCDPTSKDKSKYYVAIATATRVNIAANVIYSNSLSLYPADLPADEFRGYLKLKQRPQKKDGYYFMGEEVVGDRADKIKEYCWLITYNDTLPFSYLSRKEYLLLTKKRLEKSIQEIPSEKEYTNVYLNNVNEYLKKTEAELNQPAICMWNDEERFEKFVEEGTLGSFIAIKPNLAYYRKKLPMSSPQFFNVVYKIAHGNPVFEENMEAIIKAVDFAKLKNMLGK